MANVEIKCPGCGAVYALGEEYWDKNAVCPACEKTFSIAPPSMDSGSEHCPEAQSSGNPEAAVPAEWQVGDIILDLYEVKGIHEGGGMGLVYHVHHRGWNMDLAVKSPRPEFFQTEAQKADFTRECETWIKLGLHPHIVSCHYVRTLGGIPRVFAEYVEGGSLKDWIDNRRLYAGGPREALKRILDIAIQMAWGLDYAHDQGLIHQDVKPANVLLTTDETAKVTDFGVAKARTAAGESLTQRGGISVLASYGGRTPAYCSPEQADIATKREAGIHLDQLPKLTRRTDIWSWAVSVLEMFVGEVCWQSGVVAPAVLKQLRDLQAERNGLPEMLRDVQELLMWCFNSDPHRRPQAANELSRWLLEIHRRELNEDYARLQPVAAELRPDALNNRGLSLLDFGNTDEALRVFEDALAREPGHPESLYNRGLLLWRRGKLTDRELLALLEDNTQQAGRQGPGNYLMGLINLELGHAQGAVQNFETACASGMGPLEARGALQEARKAARAPSSTRLFQGHKGLIMAVALSSDGCLAMSAGDDKTLRLWEVGSGRCAGILKGHKNVNSVAFCPDSRLAVSWSRDETVRLWDTATCECIHTFDRVISLSADGRCALTRTRDGNMQLWEVTSGRCVQNVKSPEGCVGVHSVSGDGHLALTTEDGSYRSPAFIRLWDLASGRCVRTFEGPPRYGMYGGPVTTLSTDGRWVLSGGSKTNLRLWDAATGCCAWTLEGHTQEITSAALSADGRWALSAGRDGTLRLWDVKSGCCFRTVEIKADLSWVRCIALSGDGQRALSVGAIEDAVRLWELPRGPRSPWVMSRPRTSIEHVVQGSEYRQMLRRASECVERQEWRDAVKAAREALASDGYAQAPEARELIGRGNLHGILRSVRSGFCRAVLLDHRGQVTSVSLSANGRLALSGSRDKTLRLWEVPTGRCLRAIEHCDGVVGAALGGDGRTAVAVVFPFEPPKYTTRFSASNGFHVARIEEKSRILLWDVASERLVGSWLPDNGDVTSASLSADGRWALSRIYKDCPRLLELATCRSIRACKNYHRDFLDCSVAALSPDGRWALLAGSERPSGLAAFWQPRGKCSTAVGMWDLASEQCTRIFKGSMGQINALAISVDGRWVLAGSSDKTLRLWELACSPSVRTFEGHTEGVTSTAFSGDGHWAVSGSLDNTVRLWELATGRCVCVFEGHTSRVNSVAFSADGRWVLSGSDDKTVRLWELDWECAFPNPADWDESARPYLEIYLTQHCPVGGDGFSLVGKPAWTGEDFQKLLIDLQYRGYGWLRPEGVRRQLERMAAEWQGPPPLPYSQTG